MIATEALCKSFGATRANVDISIAIQPGEIVGLVGENGAGKSTLLSILAGFVHPDSGAITVDGRPVAFPSPGAALDAGIGLVHQHLSLVPTFTVREQLALAGWRAPALPESLANDFTGDEIIEDLSLGERQRVEIAKALVANPRTLLLDEPTSILAPSEVSGLFSQLGDISAGGTAVVIVTHKLREVMSLAGRIIVMAGGRVAGTFERHEGLWSPNTETQILARMFAWDGQPEAEEIAPTPDLPTGLVELPVAPILSVSGIATEPDPGSQRLRGITFDLLPGRMHAIVGVDGQGQTELAEVVAGYRPATGAMTLDGHDIQSLTAVERAVRGVGLLVDDRLGEAAVGSFSIAENLVLKRPRGSGFERRGIFRTAAVRKHARSVIDAWHVHPGDPEARFDTLSGGNMQRLLAAREIDRTPRVLVALNPVQGLDARTAQFLWTRLKSLCEQGSAVLIFTTDLDEAFARGDLIGVMFDGKLSTLESRSLADVRAYGSMMVNGW